MPTSHSMKATAAGSVVFLTPFMGQVFSGSKISDPPPPHTNISERLTTMFFGKKYYNYWLKFHSVPNLFKIKNLSILLNFWL
jgi:hypothetical protein